MIQAPIYVIKRFVSKYAKVCEYAYINKNGDVTWSMNIHTAKTYTSLRDALYDAKYIVKDIRAYVARV